jgi:hypothetical protein
MKNMADGNSPKRMERQFAAGSKEPLQYGVVRWPVVISTLNSPF